MSKKVTICACSWRDIIDREAAAELAKRYEENGCEVSYVDDLCRLCEQDDARLREMEGGIVVACHERAVEAMLAWRNVKAGQIVSVRKPAQKVAVNTPMEGLGGTVGEGTDAWFPVIDRSRCINCRKCHDFCLFGTYMLDEEGRVQVVNPSHCKNNCPSCARMCPAGAIIFPKHPYSPINGGLEQEETVSQGTKDFLNNKLRERLKARREGAKLLKGTTN